MTHQSLPTFKQEQREKWLNSREECLNSVLQKELDQFFDSLIDSTAQYVLENCLQEESEDITSNGAAFMWVRGWNAYHDHILAKAREMGIMNNGG